MTNNMRVFEIYNRTGNEPFAEVAISEDTDKYMLDTEIYKALIKRMPKLNGRIYYAIAVDNLERITIDTWTIPGLLHPQYNIKYTVSLESECDPQTITGIKPEDLVRKISACIELGYTIESVEKVTL